MPLQLRHAAHAVVTLGLGAFFWPFDETNAQRVEPCFTEPPSCSTELEGIELFMFFSDNVYPIDTTCRTLEDEIFMFPRSHGGLSGSNYTGFDMERDWHLLADIPADSSFCADARRYLPMCQFCIGSWRQPCMYQLDPPSCDDYTDFQDFESSGTFMAREILCHALETEIMYYNETALSDPVLRQEALSMSVGVFPGMCDAKHAVYPHCYWCDETIPDASYCYFDSICTANDDNEQQLDAVMDDTVIKETCAAVHDVIHGELFDITRFRLDRIRTWDLCQRVQDGSGASCHQELCQSCFNESHPPVCMDDPDSLPEETVQIVKDVSELQFFLRWGVAAAANLDEHVDDLRLIRASHPRCADMHTAYPHGFWCDHAENIDQTDIFFCQNVFCAFDTSDLHSVTGPGLQAVFVPYNGSDQSEFQQYCKTVQDLYSQQVRFGSTIDLCRGQQIYAEGCLCIADEEFGIEDYLGADTTAKKRALAWVSRVSAILSFLGATFVLFDVWLVSVSSIKMYHQIIIGVAVFDLVTALAWSFSTLPINDDQGYTIAGAEGTDVTCKAQGFFIQLGLTSVFYNISLATYYYLIVARKWKEADLRSVWYLFQGPPTLVGLGLACGGLPFYEGFDYACHLLPHPAGDLWVVLLFVVCPIAISVVYVTITMLNLWLIIRKTTRSSTAAESEYIFKVERMVSWQALFYTLSFYITWPVVLLVYVTGWDFDKKVYGFSLLVSFVAPLQGFNNMLVYMRPRIAKRMQTYLRARTRRTQEDSITDSNVGYRSKIRASQSEMPMEESVEESGARMPSLFSSYIDPSIVIVEYIVLDHNESGATASSIPIPTGVDSANDAPTAPSQ